MQAFCMRDFRFSVCWYICINFRLLLIIIKLQCHNRKFLIGRYKSFLINGCNSTIKISQSRYKTLRLQSKKNAVQLAVVRCRILQQLYSIYSFLSFMSCLSRFCSTKNFVFPTTTSAKICKYFYANTVLYIN